MDAIEPLAEIKDKNRFFKKISAFIYKIEEILELIVFLAIWITIFNSQTFVGGFSRAEIITYVIFGNIVGLFSGRFLHKAIIHEASRKRSGLLVYRPFRYFYRVFLRGFKQNLFPFFVVLLFHLIILYFFFDTLLINLDPAYWAVIITMVFFAFVIEFLLVYIARLFSNWVISAGNLPGILFRLKKFLAGNYFPLSLLPVLFLNVSLFLPFAYSFFVPAELFLKKISLTAGLRGLFVQAIWIIILFVLARIMWRKKNLDPIIEESPEKPL